MASKFLKLFKEIKGCPSTCNQLEQVILGGEPLIKGAAIFLREYCSIPIGLTFGISECGPLFYSLLEKDETPTLGLPLQGVVFHPFGNDSIQELLIKSPSLFRGYYKDCSLNEKAFDKNGYFKTGDFIASDCYGNLTFKGRKKDQITDQIFTLDIENMISQALSISNIVIYYEKETNTLEVTFASDENRKEIETGIKNLINNTYPSLSCHIRFHSYMFDNTSIHTKTQKFSISKRIKLPTRPKAILFPGQGTQHIGMTDEILQFTGVKKLYDHAKEILGYDILEISKGHLLNQTKYCQVAIYLASIGKMICYKESDPNFLSECCFALGLSLGEYTALSVAGSLSIEDGIHLLSLRGEAMQQASDESNQTMINISNIHEDTIKNLINQVNDQQGLGKAYITSYLHPDQCVIGGDTKCCNQMAEKAEELGAFASPLNVSGAFHTPLMSRARKEMSIHLKKVKLLPPAFKIISNVDGQATTNVNKIRQNLIKQIDHPIEFSLSIKRLKKSGLTEKEMLEIGPKKTITHILAKHFNKEMQKL